ncbi:hypothetical protein, partial [uncultured Bacteroides sp.]|uniref:hypothetical protein n=1 Tax=uncultured Bacteroides sp. TaxID=162156 RepID=UPI002598434A
MYFASSVGFSSAVFTSSFVAATGATVLYCKRFNPYPGWTLIMLSLSAMYLSAISAILLTGCNHSIFRHDDFIGCFSAD